MAFLKYSFLLLLPFLIMIAVNESSRSKMTGKPFTSHGVTTINSAKVSKAECSWNCHNDTDYCEAHHIRVLAPYKEYIDPIYFKIIELLYSTGNYGLANIIFLVIGWPLLMFSLILSIIFLQNKITILKK
jgi:hypothetical protein